MSEEQTPPPVDPAEYIAAVAQHVSSVCIITTEFEGVRYGLTATAVCSVCADPPRLLVCVNKTGFTHDKITGSGRFCVNVLTEDQDAVAMVFAGMGGDRAERFATGTWTTLTTGAPALEGAAAVFDCVIHEAVEQSTHSVLFGNVVATAHRSGRDTLLYGQRRFRQLRKVFTTMGKAPDDYL